MPLHVSWGDTEKTIICCESEGKWTWDEYHAALDQIVVMMQSVNYRVDLINIEGAGSSMPSGSPQPLFSRAIKVLPANLGKKVQVIKSTLARTIASVMTKVPNSNMNNLKMVATLEEAYAFIADDRAKGNPT